MLVIKGRNPCPERRRVLHVRLQNPHWGGLARAAVISRSIHGIIWLLGPASHTQQNKHLPPTRAERVQAAPFFYSNDPQSVINADHPAAAAAAAVWLHSAHFRSISLSRRQLAHSAAWAPARASLSIYEYFIFSHHTRPIVLLFLFFFYFTSDCAMIRRRLSDLFYGAECDCVGVAAAAPYGALWDCGRPTECGASDGQISVQTECPPEIWDKIVVPFRGNSRNCSEIQRSITGRRLSNYNV